jgi:type I restriction-modification system DNA methylase subunit
VIGLPANLFFGTGIPAAILLFNKGKKDTRCPLHRRLARVRGREEPEPPHRRQDLDKIVATFARSAVEKYAHRATIAGDRRQRLQPQHPPLRGHLRGGGRDRPRTRAVKMDGYLKEIEASREAAKAEARRVLWIGQPPREAGPSGP